MTRRMTKRGFSLMEVMIAVAIVAFISAILGGSLVRQLEAKAMLDVYSERQNTARIALLRMSREISMAYLSKHYNCVERRTQTLFKGRSGTREPLLFTSFAHYRWKKDSHESDQSEIAYYIDNDPLDTQKKALFRRESRRITDDPGKTGPEYVLAHDIEGLELSFYNADSDRWEDEWDTTRSEKKFKLPLFVKIELTLPMPDGKKAQTFMTQSRIMLQDALSFGANVCLN
ncbi:MAG: prepilin-type N-terminal cleavage/methylation domain-containing protein [Deltaproteobacteria bacterium]|nr:prepilin-type N-terminal cleavage/methylation domain-containing protein [Deltaproteobacteria bacterium]